jgi:Myb-like DNA-binding domain
MNTDGGKRIKWTHEEDTILRQSVKLFGTSKWKKAKSKIEEAIPTFDKTAKQCRERWHNFLDPDIQKEKWSESEISLLFSWHKKYGSRWSLIGEHLQGRTDNSIKNAFYCMMRKMVRRVAKYSVCADQYSTSEELDHSLYVLNCLCEYYIKPMQSTLSVPGDQYIVNVISKCGITKEKLESYIKKMVSSAPKSQLGNSLSEYAILKRIYMGDASTDETATPTSRSPIEISLSRELPPLQIPSGCAEKILLSSKQALSFTPYILNFS